MLIKRKRGWEIPEREATPEAVYHDRRRLLQAMGLGSVGRSERCRVQERTFGGVAGSQNRRSAFDSRPEQDRAVFFIIEDLELLPYRFHFLALMGALENVSRHDGDA